MKTITATIGIDTYITVIASDHHTLFIDEPISDGGGNKGMTPEEILGASLGSCTCITLRMYANRKGWRLKSIETTVTIDRNKEAKNTTMTRSIKLDGELEPEQTERLLQMANKCPIHEILTNPITVNTVLVD
ncbi:MAG: OsmC family peroxiredoxin [Sphingobacteriales bacterium]|nr:MAG: OsmC family peroxiredoxin [Sphingobacteriales bacterium]